MKPGKKSKRKPRPVGLKHDSGKVQISLAPKELIYGAARAYTYGANKYGKNNFKLGMKWSRILDATLRHLYSYIDKEESDPESGLGHLDHAAANLGMLLYYNQHKVGEDDR